MARDERAKHDLHAKLAEVLGEERTATLMGMLPPDGWDDVARRTDVERVEASLQAQLDRVSADVGKMRREQELRFSRVDERFEHVGARLDGLASRAEMDARFSTLVPRAEMEARFDRVEALIGQTKGELLAAFRGEITAAVVSQTRTMIFTMAATVAALAGLALSIAGLG